MSCPGARYLVCLLAVWLTRSLPAQGQPVARDTSFNIPATYEKERKKRPYITVATVQQAAGVIVRKDLVYRSLANRRLMLDIFYPRATRTPKPAVLLIFGGGWKSGDKTHNHAMAAALAAKGYVAVSPEYRLSGEAAYPAAVYDLKAAVRWMKANARAYGIDTLKIAVLGCSAGGQLAALIGTTNGQPDFEDRQGYTRFSSDVQAIIDIDGTLAFHHPESAEGAVAAQWLGGTYEQVPETWEAAAPLNHAGSLTPPVLFINSSIDRFHAGRDDMIRRLDGHSIYSEVHTLADTPHPFWFFHPWFGPMMGYIFNFLKKQFP